jgi:phosphohistidine phosphatase
MDLILWRHAEAEDGHPDAKRVLTAHGEKQAKDVGRWLRKRLPADARVLSSPAQRALQTAQALELPFAQRAELATGTDVQGILAAVGWPHARGTVLIVGPPPARGPKAPRLSSATSRRWAISPPCC